MFFLPRSKNTLFNTVGSVLALSRIRPYCWLVMVMVEACDRLAVVFLISPPEKSLIYAFVPFYTGR
jgi:hypothetical protein